MRNNQALAGPNCSSQSSY